MENYKVIQEVRDSKKLSEIQKVKIEYYADIYNLKAALRHYNDVKVYKGLAIDFAKTLFNDCYDFDERVSGYIDYDSFCNEMLEGYIYQFNDSYLITNVTEIK